ncbi:lipopolysaccharide biosynthesis protein [Gluconacetobacter takamatsuzukensis]|uniref:Lipopolysaccharide biosynthesis protein n=1 Tax=Gluconacetobacter takamatsuzukensis TaxID=1286190 RepID=A0A7W4KFH9_9PROT|nr:lipopolysaccharide biosynthesis protein [Gluconacetobacter takamatsuzukensis]MBB2206007.1 lipopolysaccharide biosynthesis protein [Gluconacetobacter takamatsuzukensis]
MSGIAKPSNIGARTATGAALMVAARLMTRFIDLGSMLVLTRILVPADFGLVAIAGSLCALMEAILELQINQALLRLPAVARLHYDTAFTIGLIRGVVLMAILVASAFPVARFYHDARLFPLVCFLGLSPFMRGIMSPRMVAFQKQLSFGRDFAIELCGKGISFVFGTGMALLTHSYWAIALNTVMYSGAMMVQSYCFAPYRPRLSLREIHVFAGFTGWMTMAQIVSALNWQFERLLLGKVMSRSALGMFSTAIDITNIPFLALFTPMARPLLAAFSHLGEDRERLAASYQKASVAMATVGLPLLIGESLVADSTVRVVVGPAWAGAVPMVRWLALSLTPAVFTLATWPLLLAFGRTKTLLKRNLLEFGVKFPLAIAGVLYAGFSGVIAARFASELASDIFGLFLVRGLTGLGVWEQVLGWKRSVGASVFMVLAVEGLKWLLPPVDTLAHAAVDLLACGACGAVAYTVGLCGLWVVSGRPDGIETMVFDRARRTLSAMKGRGGGMFGRPVPFPASQPVVEQGGQDSFH